MPKRQFDRHTIRLEAVFRAGTEIHRGITSDISEKGLFIRTRYAYVPGTILDIEIESPDGTTSRLRGVVKRSARTQIAALKNGMGIELIEKDSNYINLLRTINVESNGGITAATQKSPQQDLSIIACPKCGAKNKVRAGLTSLIPKCGRCGNPLTKQKNASYAPEYLIVNCLSCSVKNKVARERLSLGPRCGKCGTLLRAEDTV